MQREPSLSDAADTNEGQQAGARQQSLDLHQLTFAADEGGQRLGQIRVLIAPGTLSVAKALDDRPDKPITPPCQRLDPTLASGHLRQHTPDGRDLHREIAFFNHDAGPRRVHDRALLNKLVAPLDERGQNSHRARAQRHRNARLGEHSRFGVKPEGADFIDLGQTRIAPREATDTRVNPPFEGPRVRSAHERT